MFASFKYGETRLPGRIMVGSLIKVVILINFVLTRLFCSHESHGFFAKYFHINICYCSFYCFSTKIRKGKVRYYKRLSKNGRCSKMVSIVFLLFVQISYINVEVAHYHEFYQASLLLVLPTSLGAIISLYNEI